MKKFICSGSILLALLIICTGQAYGKTVEYEFSGTFTEGELAGYDFSGWFIYDTSGWGRFYPTFMGIRKPSFYYEDYTGEIHVEPGSKTSLGYPAQQDRLVDYFLVWSEDGEGSALWGCWWGPRINWAEPGIGPEDLIPMSLITETSFEYECYNWQAWCDEFTCYSEKTYGQGPLTDLSPLKYNLWMSKSPNRTDAVLLKSQTFHQSCSGEIYVFTDPDEDVKRVTFYLDGVQHQIENYPAYDFEGTADNGLAKPYATALLSDGTHEIRAEIELTTGGSEEVTAVFTVDNHGVPSGYDLWMSTSPNRSGAEPLDGLTVSDNIYVFTDPDEDVKRVTFYLDGVQHRVEGMPPYDFGGTAPDGSAYPTLLADGEHEIKAVIELVTGGSEEVTAVFTVDNHGVPSGYDLWMSTSPNRSGAEPLDGLTVSDNIYVFTDPDEDVKRVTFYLDGVQHRVEGMPPYDFGGTAPDGSAYPTLLADGEHEIKAVIELVTGGSEEVTAVFTVSN